MNKLLALLFLFPSLLFAQTKVNPNQISSGTLSSNITFTGIDTFTSSITATGGLSSPGTVSLTGPVTLTGNVTATAGTNNLSVLTLNNIQFCDKQAGATADVQIANAIAALPANGGIVDCRGYGATTQTWAAAVTVGSANVQNVTLILDKQTQFNIGNLGSGIAAITLASGSSIIAPGGLNPGGSRAQFQILSTSTIGNVIKTTPTSGGVFVMKGISFGVQSGATVSDAVINYTGSVQGSSLEDINLGSLTGLTGVTALKVSFASNLYIINYNCQNLTNGIVLSPTVAQGVQDVTIVGGLVAHFSGGTGLTIDGTGGNAGATANITVRGLQIESNNTGDTGVIIKNAVNVHIDSMLFSLNTNAGNNAISISDTQNITGNITLDNIYMLNAWTKTINNSVTSFSSTDSRISRYAMLEDASNPLSTYYDSRVHGKIASIDINGVAPTPYTFATLPSAPNGVIIYCSDCTIANPCAGSGNGAMGKRLNSVWVCN